MGIFGNRRLPPEPEPQNVPARIPQPPQPIPTPQQPIGFETVLGASSTLEGNFVSNANVRIDGTFTGTLEINGNVLVGETAKITADIHAKNISIAGAVRGNVTGKKVQLLRTGRVWGDIVATALTTEEGAFIDGKISMVSHDAANETDNADDASQLTDDTPAADAASNDEAEAQADANPTDEPDFLTQDDDDNTTNS